VKQLNGVFRPWMRVKRSYQATPIIWGRCIVHLSHPEFSGNVLHTSGVVDVTELNAFHIAETRNNYYVLLGPELVMPTHCKVDPGTYVMEQKEHWRPSDIYASAAMNADRDCPRCRGTGVYQLGVRQLAICNVCCKHGQGWWQLEGAYGPDNGRWACKAGCGTIVDTPPLELEFLPRAEHSGGSAPLA
jgi:hypothetical protein